MLKNRTVLIAIMAAVVVLGGVSTVIFLEESISVSDRAEVERVEEKANVSTIQYDFPLHGKSSLSAEENAYGGKLDFTISNLPKIGETAEIKMNYTQGSDILESAQIEYAIDGIPAQFYRYITITDNFEFVEPDDVFTYTSEFDDRIYHSIRSPIDASNPDVNISLSATIRAVSEGMGTIKSGGSPVTSMYIEVHVGENETLLKEDYLNLHPEMRPQRTPPQQEQIERCYGKPCPSIEDIPQVDDGSVTITPISEVPEEEFRAFLKDVMKMSDEEIEELVKKEYPDPDASTQSFFLPSAYATSHNIQLYGIVTMSDLPLSPTTQTGIHDVQVCAWEYDSVTRSYDSPICDYTNSGGGYVISGIVPSSGDNTIDVVMIYSTNSEHSLVAGFSWQSNLNNYGYSLGDLRRDNISTSTQIDRIIQTSIGIENANNAFWITDAIADTHQFILFKHGYDTDKVDVAWQFDDASGQFKSGNDRGGASYCPTSGGSWSCSRTETIILNGDSPGY